MSEREDGGNGPGTPLTGGILVGRVMVTPDGQMMAELAQGLDDPVMAAIGASNLFSQIAAQHLLTERSSKPDIVVPKARILRPG